MLYSLKSRGLTAWLWLFKNVSQAKAAMKQSSKWPGLFGPGLAWLTASGRALQSTKWIASNSKHYLCTYTDAVVLTCRHPMHVLSVRYYGELEFL